jgi:hypothetical protein
MSSQLLYDPWFIATITFFASITVAPGLQNAFNKIRSVFGEFTGYYICLTENIESTGYLVEEVMLRQIGNRVYGKIASIGLYRQIENEKKLEIARRSEGRYDFRGFINNRLMVFSYNTTIKAAHSAGAFTIRINNSGNVADGEWSGLVEDRVISTPSKFVRIQGSISKKSNDEASQLISDSYKSAFEHDISTPIVAEKLLIVGPSGVGKSFLLYSLQPEKEPEKEPEKGSDPFTIRKQ